MPTINVAADSSAATAAINKLTAALQAMNDRVAKVTSTQAVFNEAGERVGGIIRGVTKDGKEFTAVFQRVADVVDSVTKKVLSYKDALTKLSYKDKSRELDEVSQKTNNWEQILARVQRSLQYFVAYRAFNFISDQLENGIQKAKDFQIQLSLIRTISQDNQQSFIKFGQDVRAVSDKAGIDIKQVGKAFYDTVSNQIAKGANVAPFVEQATNLARVTGSELPDSVNLLSSVLNSYNLSASEADKVSASLFRTIDEGRVVASELANTFGRVLVLGNNLGVSYQSLESVVAITTQKGFKTSDALTLLTNLLIKLEKPTEATKAFFASLGVSSGEAAIKLLGFEGVLRKMVEAVKSGQVDVSAFFDEIRGRKQFGVFEQSIDQIESFSNKLKDTTETMKVYNNAIDIRGESPADKLVKEFNKISNVFTVDLGQGILKFTANLLDAVGGLNGLSKIAGYAATGVELLAGAFVAYRVTALLTAAANVGLTASLQTLTIGLTQATLAAIRFAAPLAAIAGGYMLYKAAFGGTNFLGEVDPNRLNASADAIEKVNAKIAKLRETAVKVDMFKGLDEQAKKMSESFQKAIGLVSQATIVNNKFLTDAKDKSKVASEAIKTGFAAYKDGLKDAIGEVKKGITEANNEIEKSKKKMLGFRDSLEALLYATKSKYANEDFGGDEFGRLGGQKDVLLRQQAEKLKNEANRLFATGDKDSIDEARKLYDEVAKIEQQRFELQVDLGKKQAEAAGATGTYLVDVTPLQQKLNALLAERNALETKYTTEKQKQITDGKKVEAAQEDKLRKFTAATKKFEDLDVFTADGGIKADYKTKQGKFDSGKFNSESAKLREEIRNNFTGSFEERLALEKLLYDKQKTLVAEAQAQERADYLKTLEARLLGEEEVNKKKIEDIKKSREEEVNKQKEILTDILNRDAELAAFGQQITQAGGTSKEGREKLRQTIEQYKAAGSALVDNYAKKGGIQFLDPEDLDRVAVKYKAVIDQLFRLRDEAGKNTPLQVTDGAGRTFTPGTTKEGFNSQLDDLEASMQRLKKTFSDESETKTNFDKNIAQPLQRLREQFPDLAKAANDATTSMGSSFKSLADGGLEDLRKKLQQITDLMNGVGIGKINAEVGAAEGAGESFMAVGGQVGAFPGQPRGMDRYPVWAAKGEYIVNAKSSKMFLPMLEAINNRRMPRYMASGGMVGGNTNIGDITVNVTGATTNNDTGRAIATKLNRELRRRTINLKRYT